jgi:peptidoglycan/xylan/chitin deacetylase (PgdA/CDA1 family)/CelD/BcsL family acetyltransferase involved in cellulose biosynthesis
MKVARIGDRSGFAALRARWDELLGASSADTIFLTWDWAMSWWEAYGEPGELCILTATDETGKLAGIAPLQRRTERQYGQTVHTLRFIGDQSNDSEYLDFLIRAGREAEVLAAFAGWCAPEMDRGTVLVVNEIPEASPNAPLLRQISEKEGLFLSESMWPCGTVRLPDTWEEYLRMLQPRFRTKVRSVLRNLEAGGEVQWSFCETAEEVRRLLPVLFDLHTRRWRTEGRPGVFGWDRKREFYDRLSARLLESGRLRFSYLQWRGVPLACQYGFAHRGVYSHLQEGYEPASEHWNLGIGLRAWTIRRFIEEGIREYDFLGGIGRHKADWGAVAKQSGRMVIARESMKNRLFCRGPQWEDHARESLRRVIPAAILERRAEALRPKARPAPEARGEWLRHGAAAAYQKLGAPLVPRSFRQRFELVRNGGAMPRVRPRTGPSGRILYYHRVNDEGDPFFPATPTAIFEQQMKIVARYHRAVSMRDMVRHLASGEPGCVVAITFDDGYADNYRNAWPILQRLGLTATIFLATGAVDSREPLWFERLAWSLKNTIRESLDVEIDIPRRLWLRTAEERLRANATLFEALRRVTDRERREALRKLLAQLAAPDAPECRGRMLTWDQVREMHAQGIDFGGHTVTHPFVSKLTPDEARSEIGLCKSRIEEETQSPVELFAYPVGREEDMAGWCRDILCAAEYRAAVSTIWGMNDRSTDPMELRRGQPWEDDPAVFAAKLDCYQLTNT